MTNDEYEEAVSIAAWDLAAEIDAEILRDMLDAVKDELVTNHGWTVKSTGDKVPCDCSREQVINFGCKVKNHV